MNILSYLIAIGAGAANPAQAGANAQLNKSLADPVRAGVRVYLSGLAGMLVAAAVMARTLPDGGHIAQTPWWAWTGGFISIASTMAGLLLAEKMGSGVFTGLSVTASIVMSIVIDNFGWIGFKAHAASPVRIGGGALMIAGLWLVAKF